VHVSSSPLFLWGWGCGVCGVVGEKGGGEERRGERGGERGGGGGGGGGRSGGGKGLGMKEVVCKRGRLSEFFLHILICFFRHSEKPARDLIQFITRV